MSPSEKVTANDTANYTANDTANENDEFKITQAISQDAPELAQLVNSAYRGDSSRVGWTTEADYLDGQRIDEDWLKDLIQTSGTVILCLRKQNSEKILACVELELLAEQKVLLGMLSVTPNLQNQGLGAKLMQSAEAFVASHFQAKSIVMMVISIRSELIAYYERKGYVLKDEMEAFPYGDSRFGLPKRNDLQFVRMEKTL